ncbi:MAG: S8 family serine peptidase, partial [Burkholderiales bacterium]|nr:S8 family serine peptidase [Burkholderiales bacterium]
VNAAHPDLAAQMVSGWNFYNNNSDTSDVYGHGTKVAGAAAAAGNNAIGVVGVSWRSKIMPIRVTDTAGYGYSSAIANGIVWAADRGARVVNLSFRNVAGDSMVIDAANYMRSKGGVVVAAGGNTGGELVLPASSSITAVSATNSADSRTSWSSWGNYIDVAAPGEGIWTTTSSGGYGGSSGTSFSSPVTAGVYALMMTANPALSPAELDDILFTTTVDINAPGWDVYTGHGRVNAAAAVQKALSTGSADQQAPTASITSPTGGTLSGTVAVQVSAADNIGVTRVDLLVDGKVVLSDVSAPYAFSWNSTTVANGSRTLQAKAYDAAGNVGTSAARTVTVSNDKTAPTVSISSPAAGSTLSGTVSVSMNASDNKGVTRVDLLVDGKVVASDTTSPYTISWNTTTVANGSRTLQAKAYDAAGNVGSSASRSVTVSNDKTAPTVSITSPAAGSTLSGTVSVSMNASDNKAVTRVDLLVDGKVVGSDTTSPYAISWNTAAVANGSHTLQAKAYDAAGNVGSSSSMSVKVAAAATGGDTTAPSVAIVSPTNGSTVAGVVRISLTASDNVGVARLTLFIDGVRIASMNNYGALMYDWRVPAGNGTLTSTVMAQAEDKAGNVATRSVSVKR